MGKVLKEWHFYVIFIVLMAIAVYIWQFVVEIPTYFPGVEAFSVVNLIAGISITIIGLIVSVFLSLVLKNVKDNGKKQKEDHQENKVMHAENKKMYQDVLGRMDSLAEKMNTTIDKIHSNFEQDLKLRTDHESLKKVVESHNKLFKEVDHSIKDHEDRIRKLESK